MHGPRLNSRLPESWENVEFIGPSGALDASENDDKIIRAVGVARAAFFVCAKSVRAGNLLEGGELLRKDRVYVCKPDRLVMQASFKYYEECSC